MAEQTDSQVQYTEYWQARTGLTFGIEEVIFSGRSEYQHIEILQTDAFGRLLTLDGMVMLTERDEFVYHEMITHPALCLLREPRRVLVVGGGDGGTVREVLRHASIEEVDLVEIDAMVVEAARKHLPFVSGALDDPRVNLHVRDGVAFVAETPASRYDLVLVDSTDPIGFAEALFGEDFYRDCARILTDGGILAAQTESPFDRNFFDKVQQAHRVLRGIFPEVHMYLAHIPTYPMGLWSFTMGSKRRHPVDDFDPEAAAQQLAPFEADLRYYHADLHRAAFALPAFVHRLLPGGRT